MHTVLAAAVRTALNEWAVVNTLQERLTQLSDPPAFATMFRATVEKALHATGITTEDVRQHVLSRPFVHLEGVFDASEEVDTPVDFIPLPDTVATVNARAAALAIHDVLGLETVSYGTENDGELFVNLVVMPGKGRFAAKSKSQMRGHTDGVSFPLNGDDDAENPRIAPSPDVVTLTGMRNPNNVETKVMALENVLNRMTEEDIFELKKRQFSMNSQLTFGEGMSELFGVPLVAYGEAVLTDVVNGTYVRYSHKNVIPTGINIARAREASNKFEAACNEVAQGIIVNPGDVLVVSNRRGLHGRAEPGTDFGGKSRWLLRTYGLNTVELPEKKRHMGVRPPYVLFP